MFIKKVYAGGQGTKKYYIYQPTQWMKCKRANLDELFQEFYGVYFS